MQCAQAVLEHTLSGRPSVLTSTRPDEGASLMCTRSGPGSVVSGSSCCHGSPSSRRCVVWLPPPAVHFTYIGFNSFALGLAGSFAVLWKQ